MDKEQEKAAKARDAALNGADVDPGAVVEPTAPGEVASNTEIATTAAPTTGRFLMRFPPHCFQPPGSNRDVTYAHGS